MENQQNPITKALVERKVLLPDHPVDVSQALRHADVLRPYIIGMTGRCGSTWLAAALAQLPECGHPLEYFSEEGIAHYGRVDQSGDFVHYVGSIFSQHRTGHAFGLKIDGMRLGWLSTICDLKGSFSEKTTAWVDMRRINIVKQAFSFARAKQTGIWHVESKDRNPEERLQKAQDIVNIPDSVIWHHIVSIVRSEKALDAFYQSAGLSPLRIVYEELLDSKPTLLLRVLAHLFPKRTFSVDQVMISDGTQKLSTEKNDMDELRFIEANAKALNDMYRLRSDASASAADALAAMPRSPTVVAT